ncbi:MAG TPA: helix-turn-helix domain-containing protein [Actinomycetota bacterium]|nr:helix-turn-helix domain-containing protein [Actinomycetota bacterium]HNL51691.1 helix-turn-helix domain-containing protein [Actinomycetota bacterium]
MKTTRPYRMEARAESAELTGQRILQAAVDIFWERPTLDVSLEDVADRAGVSTRTVIRRFGSKEGLMAAAAAWSSERVEAQRDQAPVGDVAGSVAVLMDHYEEYGDGVLRLLAAEVHVPALSPTVDNGRRLHEAWCRRVFAPYLATGSPARKRRRLAQFIAMCDVYTWKLLRRDAGLGRAQAELALVEMLTPLTKEQ